MTDGLRLEISEEDFKKKPTHEQLWILYRGVMQINGHGCRYGRTRWKRIFTLGGLAGLVGGFLAGMTGRLIR